MAVFFSLHAIAQHKNVRLIFEWDYNEDTVFVYSANVTLYSQTITTDHRTGKADHIDIKDFEGKKLFIKVNNGPPRKLKIGRFQYFGIGYINRKILFGKYKEEPLYI